MCLGGWRPAAFSGGAGSCRHPRGVRERSSAPGRWGSPQLERATGRAAGAGLGRLDLPPAPGPRPCSRPRLSRTAFYAQLCAGGETRFLPPGGPAAAAPQPCASRSEDIRPSPGGLCRRPGPLPAVAVDSPGGGGCTSHSSARIPLGVEPGGSRGVVFVRERKHNGALAWKRRRRFPPARRAPGRPCGAAPPGHSRAGG